LAGWLIPVILATQEAEIRRKTVQGQSGQKVSETPFQSIVGVVLGTYHSSNGGLLKIRL
jgi:hypothetical protein